MEDAGAIFSEIQKGRASIGDMLGAIAKAPINKVGGGITPMIKVPLEMAWGKSFWPDLFNPRLIRDPVRHVARTFSLDYPVAQAMKMLGEAAPTRDVGKSLAGVLLYIRDPGRMAYDNIRGKAFQFLTSKYGLAGGGGAVSPRSAAMYKWRLSKKIGDERSEALALKELKRLGGGSLAASLKRARPPWYVPQEAIPRGVPSDTQSQGT